MIDTRFYDVTEGAAASEIAAVSHAAIVRGDPAISLRSAASASMAGEGDLSFVDTVKSVDPASVRATACFVPHGTSELFTNVELVLETRYPRWSFAHSVGLIARARQCWSCENDIDLTAKIEDGAVIGRRVVIGPDVAIGSGTIIRPGAVIGPGVTIGRDCQIGANTVIGFSLIGDRVTILSGTVVGEAGFGLAHGDHGLLDTPHLGRVLIQDDVSIGANVCIDRGLFDDTVIAENAKIDNLCQLAHNVQIGAHAVIAAFAGVSGSVRIGEGAMLGGHVGIADHATIGRGAKVGGGAGIMNNVPDAETWGGFPAKPIKTWLREVAWVSSQIRKKPKSD